MFLPLKPNHKTQTYTDTNNDVQRRTTKNTAQKIRRNNTMTPNLTQSRRQPGHIVHDQCLSHHEEAEEGEEEGEWPLQDYIPVYLRRYVRPYHTDFCYTPHFHPTVLAQLMIEGFLPIACPDFCLPKLHRRRCVVSPLQTDLHVCRSIRKKCKRFNLSINTAFDRVVEQCRVQHDPHCWLYPKLVASFREIYQMTAVGSFFTAKARSNDKSNEIIDCPVRLYSIEVWNGSGDLVAGELGYTVGLIYTSLTGFSKQDSAGSVQLAALGSILIQSGFTVWDLGMEMNYKGGLGATLMPRDEFVRTVRRVRHEDLSLRVDGHQNCKDVLDNQGDSVTKVSSAAPTASGTAAKKTCKALISNETNRTSPNPSPLKKAKATP
jgi:Leu/Phe-tRNA-protein transferase